jgi:RND superfamily putative drug exporter
VQVGFIIGVGLLLDTFVVRTITVPAMAVIMGKANWWPSKTFGEKTVDSVEQPASDDDDDAVDELIDDMHGKHVKQAERVDAT